MHRALFPHRSGLHPLADTCRIPAHQPVLGYWQYNRRRNQNVVSIRTLAPTPARASTPHPPRLQLPGPIPPLYQSRGRDQALHQSRSLHQELAQEANLTLLQNQHLHLNRARRSSRSRHQELAQQSNLTLLQNQHLHLNRARRSTPALHRCLFLHRYSAPHLFSPQAGVELQILAQLVCPASAPPLDSQVPGSDRLCRHLLPEKEYQPHLQR